MVSPGRVGAARALIAIEDGAFSDAALEQHLTGKDRHLGWFLALGVLRRRAEVDAAIRPFLRQPLASLQPEVRAALRLGTFEKLWSRTKPHAAVHQAVEVCKKIGARRAQGLVNAVLRRVKAPRGLSGAEAANLPPWLYERWVARYGEAATRTWAAELLEPAPLTVVCADPSRVESWSGSGLGIRPARAGELAPVDTWRVEGHSGPVTALGGWDEGALWVQDAAAVAVADLCGVTGGTTVLDACAAPGGKTMRLASRGAVVTAVDRSPDRLVKVRENLARTKLAAELRVHDWGSGPMGDERFDVVLIDAPCTALGTVRRSPEIKWRRHELDLAPIAAKQLAILKTAATHVRPGGAVIYAVCSPEPEESEEVVAAFLAEQPTFRRVGSLHTAPPVDGEDAHTAIRLESGT